jgi:thiol-disulfide isomerase/thioredoxin
MKNFAIGLLCCMAQTICYAQTANQPKKMFADTEPLIRKYRADSQKAWDANNSKLALAYDDSIANCVVNTYLGNHKFKTLQGKIIDLGKAKRPMLITVSASWCAPCRAEIPALNKMAREYKGKVDFIVLFWDTRAKMGALGKLYSNDISLVPSDVESTDETVHEINIGGFKHINGFPTSYLVTAKKEIVKTNSGATVPGTFKVGDGKTVTVTDEQAFNTNYKRLKDDVDFLIGHNDQ